MTRTNAVELLMFGEVNPDIVVTGVHDISFGQREGLARSTTMTVGGSVAISACAAARLGTATAVVGVVGDDPFGEFMLQQLTRRGVGTDQVRVVRGGRTGSSVILVRADDPSDRQILTDLGVIPQLRAGDVDLADAGGVRHLHIGSWFLQQGAVAELPSLLAAARRQGLSTSVDPNDDPAQMWDSHIRSALPHVETVFCNESEALGIARVASDARVAARAILGRMPDDEASTVVLKCGAAGAYAFTTQVVAQVNAPEVAVVDTVGAGDTLAAAFLHARLRGATVPEALRLGVAAGSLSTRRAGGVDGQPMLDEARAVAQGLRLATSSLE